jgi:hypothetical protein
LSKRKADLLVLAPKWCLLCRGKIRVLRTQLLDVFVEQSAQISYRIFTILYLLSKIAKNFHGIFLYHESSVMNLLESVPNSAFPMICSYLISIVTNRHNALKLFTSIIRYVPNKIKLLSLVVFSSLV